MRRLLSYLMSELAARLDPHSDEHLVLCNKPIQNAPKFSVTIECDATASKDGPGVDVYISSMRMTGCNDRGTHAVSNTSMDGLRAIVTTVLMATIKYIESVPGDAFHVSSDNNKLRPEDIN